MGLVSSLPSELKWPDEGTAVELEGEFTTVTGQLVMAKVPFCPLLLLKALASVASACARLTGKPAAIPLYLPVMSIDHFAPSLQSRDEVLN